MENSTRNNPEANISMKEGAGLLLFSIMNASHQIVMDYERVIKTFDLEPFSNPYKRPRIKIPASLDVDLFNFTHLVRLASNFINRNPMELYKPMAEDTKLPPEFMDKLNTEISQLRASLDARIPEFAIQLQTVLGRLQEMPEATWALTDDQRKVIVDGFKQNVNVTVFQSAKTASIKNHKIKGEISVNMF
jgi:hypothetical protein